ncbi:MAG: MBL fold metallo-hydrolase [Clostridia bacterium]|nr:MBL fold metallo-hydrolase [Clostridia bacterium]
MTERIVSEFIESNVFVVSKGNECVIVDAAANLSEVKKVVGEKKVFGVLLTHGHYDHSLYANEYAKEFGTKIFASEAIVEYLQNPDYNYSEGQFKLNDFSNFQFLNGEGTLNLGGMKVDFCQLGGHSKSDICFLFDGEIFVGDVLIGRDIGRLDLHGGSKKEMKNSLEKFLKMDYQIMHSGHGEDNSKEVQDKVVKLWLRFLSR